MAPARSDEIRDRKNFSLNEHASTRQLLSLLCEHFLRGCSRIPAISPDAFLHF
jgi:hypothetical protein